jgi:hypothetical protein
MSKLWSRRAAGNHRNSNVKWGPKNYKQKTTEGPVRKVFIMILLSGKCSPRTPNKNYGFLFFICLILNS